MQIIATCEVKNYAASLNLRQFYYLLPGTVFGTRDGRGSDNFVYFLPPRYYSPSVTASGFCLRYFFLFFFNFFNGCFLAALLGILATYLYYTLTDSLSSRPHAGSVAACSTRCLSTIMVYGIYMVHGTWYMVHGITNLAFVARNRHFTRFQCYCRRFSMVRWLIRARVV